jgi:hypothetical protein
MPALRPVLPTALFFNPQLSGRPILNAWPLGISLDALGMGHFFRPPRNLGGFGFGSGSLTTCPPHSPSFSFCCSAALFLRSAFASPCRLREM